MMLKKLIKNLFYYSVYKPYFAIKFCWPVWFYIGNRKARKLYRKKPTKLSPAEQKIGEELRRNGIAISHLAELFPRNRDLFDDLQKYAEVFLGKAEVKTSKTFLRNLWEVTPLLDFGNPFVRLALEDKILGIISHYFEMYPKFYYFTLNITEPILEGQEAEASQRWHRDPEDKKMIKVFLYLNDVDETAGPFMYVPGSHYGGKLGKLFPQRLPRGRYIPAAELEKEVTGGEFKICTGQAGTVIFCDTAGFHKGGYATRKERLMFTAGYCSSASPWPDRYRYPLDFKSQQKILAPIANYAVQPQKRNLASWLLRFKKSF